jgi:hypothetical protein
MSATLILRTVAAGGLRPEFEHTRTRQCRGVQSPNEALSPRSRQINARPINRYTFVWKNAQLGTRALVRSLYAAAAGTVLPMRFTPAGHTDADTEDVYFVGPPKYRRVSPMASAIEFEVEGRH